MAILWFKQLSKADADKIGEKAAYLAELYNKAFPVPNGFVIPPEIFKNFIAPFQDKITSLLENTSMDFESINSTAGAIREIILNASFPQELQNEILTAHRQLGDYRKEYVNIGDRALELISSGRDPPPVAVRASLIKEVPFLIPPKLNISGIVPLISAIKEIWVSAFSPRAILYYLKTKTFLIPAVIIQKMIFSTKSGNLFTINPLTNEKEELLVEAIWGIHSELLENPTQIILAKRSKEIKQVNMNAQLTQIIRDSQSGNLIGKPVSPEFQTSQVLSKVELEKISEIATKIEQLFNFPAGN